MKNLKVFFLITILLALFAGTCFAQTTEWDSNAAESKGDTYGTVYFEGTVSETDTLISNEFDFTGLNPIVTGFKFFSADSGAGKPRIKVMRKYTYFTGATPIYKTIYTADSLETQVMISDTIRGQNQMLFIGTGTNPVDTKIKWLYVAEPK